MDVESKDGLKLTISKIGSKAVMHKRSAAAGLLCLLSRLPIGDWPRLLTICAHYSETTVVIRAEIDPSSSAVASASTEALISSATANATTTPSASATVEFVVPISINSSNLWGLTIDTLRVDAYYDDKHEAALARPEAEADVAVERVARYVREEVALAVQHAHRPRQQPWRVAATHA